MSRPVVYNKSWTIDCIQRIRTEMSETDKLCNQLTQLRRMVDPSLAFEVRNILADVQKLEMNLETTYRIMDEYMHNMERSTRIIANKIDEAHHTGKSFR